MTMTQTVISNSYGDAVTCLCGNDVMDEGFYPADPRTREYVEATIDGRWDGKTIMCGHCGRLIDQSTLRPNPAAASEGDTHLMTAEPMPVPTGATRVALITTDPPKDDWTGTVEIGATVLYAESGDYCDTRGVVTSVNTYLGTVMIRRTSDGVRRVRFADRVEVIS